MGVALVGVVLINNCMGYFVAKRLKLWTADQEVPGSGPTDNRDFFFSSGYTQQLRRRVTFVSFGRDMKPLVLGT